MRYVWDPFVRIFHWSLVAAFATAFLTHASEWERLTHVNAGYIAGGLIISRIIWGLMKTGYASFQSFPLNPLRAARYVFDILRGHAKPFIGHNPAGSLVIYLMLTLGLLTVCSGYLVYNDGWLIDASDLLHTLHFVFAWSWLFLVTLHVIGVITESILHKDNLIAAMFTGVKHNVSGSEDELSSKDVSRETIRTFAQWTLAVREIYKSYRAIDRANEKIYRYMEENDLVNNYGVTPNEEKSEDTK